MTIVELPAAHIRRGHYIELWSPRFDRFRVGRVIDVRLMDGRNIELLLDIDDIELRLDVDGGTMFDVRLY